MLRRDARGGVPVLQLHGRVSSSAIPGPSGPLDRTACHSRARAGSSARGSRQSHRARGLAGYWRTPGVLRGDAGLEALGIGPDERFVGLVHLGPQRQDKEAPERAPVAEIVEYLS